MTKRLSSYFSAALIFAISHGLRVSKEQYNASAWVTEGTYKVHMMQADCGQGLLTIFMTAEKSGSERVWNKQMRTFNMLLEKEYESAHTLLCDALYDTFKN